METLGGFPGVKWAICTKQDMHAKGGSVVTHVVTLTEEEMNLVRLILLDGDGRQALAFLRDRIQKPVDGALRKGMDTSKGKL